MNKEELESVFLNSEKFYKEVDALVWSDDIDYMDAIMSTCDKMNINPEDLTRLNLISPKLKSRLQEECTANGMLKPSSSLPI